jgi:hypothetical protein
MKDLKRDSHSMKLRFGISIAGSALTAIGYAGTGAGVTDSFVSHVGVVLFITQMMMFAMHAFLADFIAQVLIFIHEFAPVSRYTLTLPPMPIASI